MKIQYLVYGLLTLFFYSCHPTYYKPNITHAPLFTEKGESAMSLSYGNHNNIEAHAAYAINDKIGLMTNFVNFKSSHNNKGSIFELGAGYFQNFPYMEYLVFENYGLIGYGKMYNDFSGSDNYARSDYRGSISANILRVSNQANIGLKYKYFSAAFSLRLSYLHYNNIYGNLRGGYIDDMVEDLRRYNNHVVLDPGLILRAGLKNVKFQLSLTTALPLTPHNLIPETEGVLSAGVFINLFPKKNDN